MSTKLKITVIGPNKSGKTLLCNAIADMIDNNNTKYEPTEGVRILDTEIQLTSSFNNGTIDVELWDCSGLSRFQLCWPVMQLDAQGVVFVYNPDVPDHATELELFYDYFAVQSNLTDACCLLLANQQTKIKSNVTFPATKFEGVMRKTVNILTEINEVKSYFNEFIETLVSDIRSSFEPTKSSLQLF